MSGGIDESVIGAFCCGEDVIERFSHTIKKVTDRDQSAEYMITSNIIKEIKEYEKFFGSWNFCRDEYSLHFYLMHQQVSQIYY